MAKLEDITDRLHSLKKESHHHRHAPTNNAPPAYTDFQFRPFTRDNYVISLYVILGLALVGQVALILLVG